MANIKVNDSSFTQAKTILLLYRINCATIACGLPLNYSSINYAVDPTLHSVGDNERGRTMNTMPLGR